MLSMDTTGHKCGKLIFILVVFSIMQTTGGLQMSTEVDAWNDVQHIKHQLIIGTLEMHPVSNTQLVLIDVFSTYMILLFCFSCTVTKGSAFIQYV